MGIQGFFDSKWLGFSGKILGALGVWGTSTTLPPFNPNRVVREQYLAQVPDSATYEETSDFEPLHIEQPSSRNLSRRAKSLAPETTLAWYSIGSKADGRGALMVYMPANEAYWMWYVSFAEADPWRLTRCSGISRPEFELLELTGSGEAEA